MGIVIGLVALFVVVGVALALEWRRRRYLERLRRQARQRIVEDRMAAMQAALRIRMAEEATRRLMYREAGRGLRPRFREREWLR